MAASSAVEVGVLNCCVMLSFTTLWFGSCLTVDKLNIVGSVEHRVGSPGPPRFKLEIICNVFIINFVLSDNLGWQRGWDVVEACTLWRLSSSQQDKITSNIKVGLVRCLLVRTWHPIRWKTYIRFMTLRMFRTMRDVMTLMRFIKNMAKK